jgi:hypothetical protein
MYGSLDIEVYVELLKDQDLGRAVECDTGYLPGLIVLLALIISIMDVNLQGRGSIHDASHVALADVAGTHQGGTIAFCHRRCSS